MFDSCFKQKRLTGKFVDGKHQLDLKKATENPSKINKKHQEFFMKDEPEAEPAIIDFFNKLVGPIL